jgi:hypothetical protein
MMRAARRSEGWAEGEVIGGNPKSEIRNPKKSLGECFVSVAQRGTLLFRRRAAGVGNECDRSFPSCETAGCQPALHRTQSSKEASSKRRRSATP